MKGLNPFLLLGWIKARISTSGANCVEFEELAEGLVAIRNSKRPEHVECLYTGELKFFLEAINRGVYHLSKCPIKLECSGEAHFSVFREGWTTPIIYDPQEWACFLDGVKKQEFDHLVSTPSKYASYEEAMEAFITEVKNGKFDKNKKFAPLVSRFKRGELKYVG